MNKTKKYRDEEEVDELLLSALERNEGDDTFDDDCLDEENQMQVEQSEKVRKSELVIGILGSLVCLLFVVGVFYVCWMTK